MNIPIEASCTSTADTDPSLRTEDAANDVSISDLISGRVSILSKKDKADLIHHLVSLKGHLVK